MKITPQGITVGGAAGDEGPLDGVFVNNTLICNGGTATTNGSRVFYQSESATVRSCDLDGSNDDAVLNVGASLIVAGGNQWAVWLKGSGIWTSWGLRLPPQLDNQGNMVESAVMAMTETGDLLTLASYTYGKGLAMYRAGSATAAWALPSADPTIRYPYPQAFALDANRVVWANPAGTLFTRGLPQPKQVGPAFDPLLVEAPDGRVWVGYHTYQFILHPIDDASKGYILAEGMTYGTTATGQFVGYSRNAAESDMVAIPVDWSADTVSLAPPPVPQPIGPLGPSLPAGTVYDLSPFFTVDDRSWPRGDKARGDTHGMDMQRVPELSNAEVDTWWHAKFDKDGQGKCGELLSMEKAPNGRIHLRADASNSTHPTKPFVDTWTDSTWLFKTMTIGQPITIKCERVWYHPVTGVELGREHYTKNMELLHVWERYWGGEDVGQGRCIEYRYNVERYREFIGDDGRVWGWGDWDYNDGANTYYSRFWLKGGQRFPVRLPNCPMPIAILPQEPTVPDFPMPPSVLDTLRAFANVFPLPQGGDDVAMHTWSRKAAEQVKFTHNAPGIEYGLKSTTSTSPVSNNLARRDQGLNGIHIWDYIEGSAGQTPTLKHDGGQYFFAQQVFHPVQAINHLDLQPPSQFPPLVLPHWGATGFDLAAAVTNSETAYYDLLKTKKLKPRVQVYATIDHPATGRYYRDYALGLQQMRVLLPKMQADGLKGQFVYLVGTAADGVSRDEAIRRIREIDALVCGFPPTIAGRQGGNELYYPGLEQPYMSDDAFWDEVERLINPNFPWTRGAGHGGAGVNMSGGSYLVHHSDRALGPDAAGAILADAKRVAKRNIIDDEGKRIEQGGDGGQSTGDLNFVRGQIANAKLHGYGLTLHVAGGRSCRLGFVDAIQLQAIDLVAAEVGATPPPGGGGGGSLPVPIPAEALKPGERLLMDKPLWSGDKRFFLLYQSDGNLVLYTKAGSALWASHTQGTSVGSVDMQGDGNLVMYDAGVKPRWSSKTNGNEMAWAIMQNDGNFVIYSATGKPLWATGTIASKAA